MKSPFVDTFCCKTELKSSFCLFTRRCFNMAPDDVTKRSFIDVIGALDHVAVDENRNAVFIWSVDMCFMFAAQINVIFMRPLYEAVILCDCNIICLFNDFKDHV